MRRGDAAHYKLQLRITLDEMGSGWDRMGSGCDRDDILLGSSRIGMGSGWGRDGIDIISL